MSEQQIRTHLRSWILEHSKRRSISELRDATPLLEQGILSSLDIVEFVLFIENLRGEELDTDAIAPEVFTSIDTLYDAFFADAVGVS